MENKSSLIILSVLVLLCGCYTELGLCTQDNILKMKLGGVHDCKGFQNSAEIDSLARFAVQEHNKKENAILEFVRVLKAKEQVVAGKLYHLTVEATDAGNNKMYEVKVWVKPWMNFKQLQEFKHVEGGTSTDLGVKPAKSAVNGIGSARYANQMIWVPTNDLEVQDAANHAVNSIQKRSNSLYPYELLEILVAKAKVIEDYAKFNLLLKLRRGIKEEKFQV
ncbi:hypothetical protein OIU84_026586 [Salix udensis]|uniref:Cysteine proteinase inhibitor n=1 Tax=Salix udensis TaxID=889485 RepID=A0AAD6KM28_9ROSI|nr:hypothetical protein OIU84_026586 [Salix udensis]